MNALRIFKIILALSFALGLGASQAHGKSPSKSQGGDSGLGGLKYNVGDETGNDSKALKAEMLIAAQEEKAMAQIQKLLKKYRGTQLEADLLMRMAELYMRRAKTDRFLEMHRGTQEAMSIGPKQVKASGSRQQITKAVQLFDEIERRFPRFEKLDAVVFNNAFANQQLGDSAKAERKFQRLVKDFSESPLVPDGHLALGELEFRNRNFNKALAHFSAIRKFPDSLVYPYGIYKAGWTMYNLRDADGGLKELEDVIKYGRFVQEQGIDARLDLRKEALVDMALFYEDVRSAKDAYSYFEKQAADLDVSPVILRLSELYKRHGRHQDIKTVLSDLIKRHPASNYVPMAYVELMDASEKLKKSRDVVTLLGSFAEVCEPDSKWVKAQTIEGLTSKESPLTSLVEDQDRKTLTPSTFCMRVFKRMALGYANKWLRIWQKENNQIELADSAESAFSVYLKYDDKSDEAARARFVFSELQFKRTKYREASENYALAALYTKDAKIGHDARYYALLSLEKAVKDKWSDKDEKRFRSLASDYLAKNKNAKYRLDIDFKLALIAYEKGRYEEAAPTFLRLGQTYGKEEKGLKAQDLYLDILNLKKDYVALRDYSGQLRGKVAGERLEKLTKIHEEAYFVIIQALEERGETADAIAQYQAFAQQNPNSKLTQKALWNTVQLYYKTNDPMNGASSAVAYFEKYPDSKEGFEALIKAAQTFESLGQLQPAAQVLEKIARVDKEHRTKWTLMAADFYLLSYQLKKARPLYESLPPGTEAGYRAQDQLEFIARVEGRTANRVALLKDIMSSGRQPQASLAAVQFVEDAYAQQRYEEAFNQAKKVMAQEKSGAAKSALARARLIQARVLEKEFRAQSVKSKIERIQTVLTLKTEKLARAQVAYQGAASYGDALIAVQAYRELADCYLHYNDALRGMPIPEGVPAEEGEAFRAEMDKLAIPMEEKGIETKMLAYQAARELGVDGALISELQDEMKKLNQPTTKDHGIVKLVPAALATPKEEVASQSTCPNNDRGWRKEPLRNLMAYAAACARAGKTDRLEALADNLAQKHHTTPWGPFYLAVAAEHRKELSRALWMIDLAIKKSADVALLHYEKGRIHWALGEFKNALEAYRRTVKADPRFVEAHLFLAQLHFRDQDYKNAVEHYLSVVRQQPEHPTGVAGLAESYAQLGKTAAAIEFFEKAVNASPRNIAYKFRLAALYENTIKDYAQALTVYKRIKTLLTEQRTPAEEVPMDINEKIRRLEDMVNKTQKVQS